MQESEDKIVKIGKVNLDYSLYGGQDLYCDGVVEQELLQIVREKKPEEYAQVIAERADWPTLYHLSPARENIVDWIPFTGEEKVLEIGAGPGAITGKLAEKAKEVTCVELSSRRSSINAERHKDADNICIHVGNFEDIEPLLDRDFDYIFLIGVFEYAGSYINSREPYKEEMRRILSHLKKDGRVIIAIENRLGMKYFAGCREDHSGRYFDGVAGYASGDSPAETFSRPALENIFRSVGVQNYSFYYPYPDYKLMHTLYSDAMLPNGPELTDNIRNFDRDRLLLFDEKEAFRSAAADGLFPVFSNSYLIVLGPELPVKYAKYSTDRAPQYRIVTRIAADEQGKLYVVKTPACAAAREHIAAMPRMYELLTERYKETGLQLCPCELRGEAAVFPFLSGETLESLLDEKLFAGDEEGFRELLTKYKEVVTANDEAEISDPDMTFANILVDKDGNFSAIDYEWAKEEKMDGKALFARALTIYLSADEKRTALAGKQLHEVFGLTQSDLDSAKEIEKEFQRQVTGGVMAMADIREAIGNPVIIPSELNLENALLRKKAGEEVDGMGNIPLATVQVYYDNGYGYNEEDSYFDPKGYEGEGQKTILVEIRPETKAVRIDPALCPCFVLVREVALNDVTIPRYKKVAKTNGAMGGNGTVVFATPDPWFSFDIKKLKKMAKIRNDENLTLRVELQMVGMPATMCDALNKGN